MASEANVYALPIATQVWYTDKCEIAATGTVTYQVLLAPAFTDTIYSAPVTVPAGATKEIYVGVGNQVTITGAGSALELGTASSAQAGVN